MTKRFSSLTLCSAWLVVSVLATSSAEASVPRDLSRHKFSTKISEDPFATAPKLDPPSLTQQLRAIEERQAAAAECVALCEIAAGIEAQPFGVAAAEPLNRSEDAWGQFRFKSELVPSHNRFGFTGHYWDNEASLYYAKARYYDPFTASFTQADSFLGAIDDPPSLHRYQYANANPTMFVDPSGNVAVIDNFLGGALSTVIGFGVTCATKGCAAYMPEDAAVDFSLGFASSGLSGLKALKYAKDASLLANTAKIGGRVAAQYGVGFAGEVTRHELKGEEYTVEEVSQQAVVGALIGEAGDLGAKAVRAGARQVSSLLSKSESGTAKFLTREVSSFLPDSLSLPFAPSTGAVEQGYRLGERMPNGLVAGDGPGAALMNAPRRPGGYQTLDVDAYRRMSPSSSRAVGHQSGATDGLVQAHHFIQDRWAIRNVTGYVTDDATAILLRSASGEPHSVVSAAQRLRRNQRVLSGLPAFGGDLKGMFNTSYRDLIDAGVSSAHAKRAARKAYKYFDSLGAFSPGN